MVEVCIAGAYMHTLEVEPHFQGNVLPLSRPGVKLTLRHLGTGKSHTLI